MLITHVALLQKLYAPGNRIMAPELPSPGKAALYPLFRYLFVGYHRVITEMARKTPACQGFFLGTRAPSPVRLEL